MQNIKSWKEVTASMKRSYGKANQSKTLGNKQNKALKLAQSIRTALIQDQDLKASYPTQIKYLDDRIEQWQKRTWFVGIIGITSSGKSTILNALFQEELLPSGVRPSSNCLIKCHKGPKLECTVVYTSGKKTKYTGASKALSKLLSRFGDERLNSRNHEGIEEIILSSPKFLLPEGIVLIDSPGLDAFGHQDHEEVTLHQLVPTVDLVLYTTCTKASSDERLGFYAQLITDHKKPILLLQNKIDSIVPKRGRLGKVIKSVDEIKTEHRRRLENSIVKNCTDRVLDNISIFQISARLSLKGQHERSGIQSLIKGFEQQIAILKPSFDHARLQQLGHYLSDIIKNLEEQLSLSNQDLLTSFDKKESKFNKIEIDILNDHSQLKNQLKNHAENIKNEFSKIESELRSLGINDQRKARTISNRYKTIFDKVASPLSKIIKSAQKLQKKHAKMLNLQPEDYAIQYKSKSRGTGQIRVSEKTKTESYRERVKVNRFTGFFGDLFGNNWGYEYQTRTRTTTKLDVKKFTEQVKAGIKQTLGWLKQQNAKIESLFAEQNSLLIHEVKAQLQGINDHRQSQLTNEKKRTLLKLLKTSSKNIPSQAPKLKPTKNKVIYDTEVKKKLTINKHTAKRIDQLARVSSLFQKKQQRKALQVLIPKIYQSTHIVIWGWDSDSILKTFNRMFHTLEEAQETELIHSLETQSMTSQNSYEHMVTLVKCGQVLDQSVRNLRQQMIRQSQSNIVVTNAGQIGSFLSAFKRAELDRLKEKQTLFMIESVDECESGEQLGEQLKVLQGFTSQFAHNLGWSALHNNLNYTLLVQSLNIADNRLNTQLGLQKFVNELSNMPLALGAKISSQYISQCVRSFYNNH